MLFALSQILYTVNDLLYARGVYLIFVLKGGRLIDTRRLLEGACNISYRVCNLTPYS